MPVNEGLHILAINILLTVLPMWPNCPNPVDLGVRGAGESSVGLLIELPFKRCAVLPIAGSF